MAEYYYNFQSDAGLLTQDHALRQWGDAYRSAMEIEHRDPRVGHRLGQMMADAGLVDVRSIKYDLPIGPWSSGKVISLIYIEFSTYSLHCTFFSFSSWSKRLYSLAWVGSPCWRESVGLRGHKS